MATKKISGRPVRRMWLLPVLMLSSVLFLGSHAWGDTVNVIQNPSFESGNLTPWLIGTDYCGIFGDAPCSPWSVSSSEAHSGDNSLQDTGDTEILQYFDPISGFSINEISFWMKQDPALMFGYELLYSDGTAYFALLFPADNDWAYYDVTSNLDLGKSLVGIGFVNYSASDGNGPVWLDDVTVSSYSYGPVWLENEVMSIGVPEPSSMMLLLVGCIAIKARCRKSKSPETE